jgi:hypothetical protein
VIKRHFVVIAFICAHIGIQSAFAGDPVTIPESVPYAADAKVKDAIKTECDLGRGLSRSLSHYAHEFDISTEVAPATSEITPGRALTLAIVSADGKPGGRWTGGKTVTVEGKLYEQGKVVGSFTARRVTKTGYRLCEALDKDVRVIGVDILKWLREPKMNSSLGNI